MVPAAVPPAVAVRVTARGEMPEAGAAVRVAVRVGTPGGLTVRSKMVVRVTLPAVAATVMG